MKKHALLPLILMPFAGALFGIWFVCSSPPSHPDDVLPYSIVAALIFGLAGTGAGYILFRLFERKINVVDAILSMIGVFAILFCGLTVQAGNWKLANPLGVMAVLSYGLLFIRALCGSGSRSRTPIS
jgi:hypothetical protein